ncbi:bifunctional hydroxymethylpyrimidine kinase/phosphomethylpyrimidine kinase [Solibacillus sp. MA9]|uniref:Hydroxymethylpyrimidine/phosphomethylpyrimidine kinase n=1 Tax=Solibacillus palustris TaxID=2908203 RepID=A0ABS9UBF6_9BACL|nr:bifunctional hydroxymethylpyrimidine kinase/phosphomethylpyrimidine kinase [Solibacillus sp. MA9]MCH7321450.1 bifunctional hydroxymethylpyrimidine kinase/phosphomethylpyrimidine kinase [Solibacillus sp. MA9]
MIACTIAGSDSSGGAGIQADIKTFQELGVFGTSVITALTAQNTLGVHGIYPTTVDFVQAQLKAVLEDLEVKAIKTGMLFNAEIIAGVVSLLNEQHIPLIVDPVMIAKGGASLLQQQAVLAMKEQLLPLATVCTPNIPEAEVLTGRTIETAEDIELAGRDLLALGVKCVVMKGGHLQGEKAIDTVFISGEPTFMMETERYETKHTHGTGCTFSAAITAEIAKGSSLKEAIIEAKTFVQLAISNPLNIGHGFGPTNHFVYRQQQGTCKVNVF